jgi:hypothetical protein
MSWSISGCRVALITTGSEVIAPPTMLGALSGKFFSRLNVPDAVTPEQASRFTPEQVQQIASHAEQHSPGIIDEMNCFYAEQPGLIKTLGSAALTMALARMAGNHQTRS